MSKYILYVSLVLNGILLIFLAGPVPFFLYLSIVVNIGLLWYSATCLLAMTNMEEDMIVLLRKNESFLGELESVHSLEMYYGDEALQSLINHSREVVNDFIDIQEKYFDVEVEELEYEEDETETPEE
jgi:hypothetical protein